MDPKLKRFGRILAGLCLVLIVVLFLHATLLSALVDPPLVRIKAKQLLSQARTSDDFKKAVGGLGLFLPLTNGAWVAIHYRDSHTGLGWSQAVALDSQGNWFESGKHFCGRFAIYRQLQQRNIELAEKLRTSGAAQSEIESALAPLPADVLSLATTTNIESLHRHLTAMGFRQTK